MTRTATAWAKSHWSIGSVLILLGLVIVVINPLRQAANDDDWSYARTVRHLLETGTYQLDNWSAANPVFQVYWGTLFAHLFGYSFGSLRVSTLVLLAGGLCGMYALAREHGLSARRAGLLTLILLVNPLTVVLGFSYMTDVPFVAITVLALACYTRATRLNSYRMMVLGSAFAAAAILIRVFGAAFLPGLWLVWLLSSRKRERLRLFLTASALPLLAVGWQISENTDAPNWAVPVHGQWQAAYLTDMYTMPGETIWRLAVVLMYLALFSLPLIPVALAEWWQSLAARPSREGGGRRSWREPAIVAGLVVFLAVANLLKPQSARRAMPILGWNFDVIKSRRHFAIALTLIMLVGAFVYARAVILRCLGGSWRDIPDHERLLDAVTLGLLLLQITYFQFGDEYLLPLLPFTLIVVAQRAGGWLDRLEGPTIALASAVMVVSVLWVRGIQEADEAVWAGADNLLAKGVPAQQISSDWVWASYNGAFDNFLRSYGGHPPGEDNKHPCRGVESADSDTCARDDPRKHYGYGWLADIDTSALYYVRPTPPPYLVSGIKQSGSQLQLVATIPYRDMLLCEKKVYVYKRP